MDNKVGVLLEGQVAAIVSEREIAINIGKRNGVKQGMRFAVLTATPQVVNDPVTGEILDTIDRPKVQVEATEVREKMTICSTYRQFYVGGGFMGNLFQLTQPASYERETLRIEDSELPAPLDEEESYVKIGDRVRQLRVKSSPEKSTNAE